MTTREALRQAIALLEEVFEWRPIVREREDAAKLAEWRKALAADEERPGRDRRHQLRRLTAAHQGR